MRTALLRAATAIVLLGLVVAGCSRVGLVYNRLDWIIPWYVSDFITFTDAQQTVFDNQLVTSLRWHRRSELPRYAQLLRALRRDLADGLTEDEINRLQSELEQVWDTLVRQLAADAAPLLTTLSADQIAEVFSAVEQRNRKYADKYLTPRAAAARENRIELVRKQLERWWSPLGSTQQRLLKQWGKDYEADAEGSLAYRRTWQAALRRALESHDGDGTALANGLGALLSEPESQQPPAFRLRRARNLERFKTLLIEIDRTATSYQRQFLANRLEDWAAEFQRLATRAD